MKCATGPRLAIVIAAVSMGIAACSGSSSSSSSSSPSPSAAPLQTALPAGTKTQVTFSFGDVSIATGGDNTLRLGFTINNATGDPLLCDPSEFSVQLDDNTVVAADQSADDTCDPGTVDPQSTGQSTMFFDLPNAYTGGITMMMIVDGKVVGQGTTALH